MMFFSLINKKNVSEYKFDENMKHLKLFENYKEESSLIDVLVNLGYINPRKIANGGSSTIWTCSNKKDTIIKLTNSRISANTMQYVRKNIIHPNFIKIKNVYKVVGDITIIDSIYNYNPYNLNSYPLYVIETEDLERLDKKDLVNMDYDYYLNLCDEQGIWHQDLHKDNLMKRKTDNEIVMIDILDDSLPEQNIKTLNIEDFLLENDTIIINEKIDIKRTESGKIKYRGELFPGYNKPKRAPKGDKHKYRVLAKEGDKIGIVSFGARGYDDFLQHKDTKRRKNFRARMRCDKKYSKLTAKYWVCHYNW